MLQFVWYCCSLGACISILCTTFSPACGAWHSPWLQGEPVRTKDLIIMLNTPPDWIGLSELVSSLCTRSPKPFSQQSDRVLLQHTQQKPAEICSSRNAKVAPRVFCRTTWGAGGLVAVTTAVCTKAWSICPGSLLKSERRVTNTRTCGEPGRAAALSQLLGSSAQSWQQGPDFFSSGWWNRFYNKGN